jgi:glycosyltransferase involved in cell wall biosynthesis
VVITTYNHARFLGEAILSVLSQTAPPDEILVIDDGSTDDPALIVRRCPNIVLIRQANKGLSAARNTGWHAARGRYVAFLDADDRFQPTMIATNLAQFQERPNCAFVYGAYDNINEAGSFLSTVPLRPVGNDPFGAFLEGNCIGMHGTVLYRRECLEKIGGFDSSLQSCEDYDLYLRLSRRYPVSASPERLADYRRHDSNMSNNVPRMLSTALTVLRRHKDAAQTRQDWNVSYRRGFDGWKRHYSHVQCRQFIGALSTRSRMLTQAVNTVRVARLAPTAVLRELCSIPGRWWRACTYHRPVNLGDLHRTKPFSDIFGYDRGKPLDRRYVDNFLQSNSSDIRGRVLEIGDNAYTLRYGGDQVFTSDVLNRYLGRPATTFVDDLTTGHNLPSNTFDCIVLTQTLHLIFDMPSAVATLWRILKPGGVLLLTVPWISSIDHGEWRDEWCWSISPRALERLLCGPFAPDNVQVTYYGNVLSATAFLYGLAEHELAAEDLDIHDPCYPVIVAGRATKAETGG